MIKSLATLDYSSYVFRRMFNVQADRDTVISFTNLTTTCEGYTSLTTDCEGYFFILYDFIGTKKGAELVVKTSTDNGVTYDKEDRYSGVCFRFLLTPDNFNVNAIEFGFSFGDILTGSISVFSMHMNTFKETMEATYNGI